MEARVNTGDFASVRSARQSCGMLRRRKNIDSGASGLTVVEVRVLFRAPFLSNHLRWFCDHHRHSGRAVDARMDEIAWGA